MDKTVKDNEIFAETDSLKVFDIIGADNGLTKDYSLTKDK
jgi:hypothetical protein